MSKKFKFSKIVYLTDTNAFGNTYFAKYFEWQGMAREEFFKQIAGGYSEMLTSGVKYITISASVNFKKESFLFNKIGITVEPKRISLTTVELLFTFTNEETNEVLAIGKQKIGFSNIDNVVIPIPRELLEGAKKYLDKVELKNVEKVIGKLSS